MNFVSLSSSRWFGAHLCMSRLYGYRISDDSKSVIVRVSTLIDVAF